jgi:hypothetical protein
MITCEADLECEKKTVRNKAKVIVESINKRYSSRKEVRLN